MFLIISGTCALICRLRYFVVKEIDGYFQVEPISQCQQAEVADVTLGYIQRASQLYSTRFAVIPILFDLRGKSSGMYQRTGDQKKIRFNPWLFAKDFQQSIAETVPHEVAHYITDCLWTKVSVKPHGCEWQSVMKVLGVSPKVTGNYDLTGVPVKQYQRVAYHCVCQVHQLTLIRHRRILSGRARYHCRTCRGLLKAVSA